MEWNVRKALGTWGAFLAFIPRFLPNSMCTLQIIATSSWLQRSTYRRGRVFHLLPLWHRTFLPSPTETLQVAHSFCLKNIRALQALNTFQLVDSLRWLLLVPHRRCHGSLKQLFGINRLKITLEWHQRWPRAVTLCTWFSVLTLTTGWLLVCPARWSSIETPGPLWGSPTLSWSLWAQQADWPPALRDFRSCISVSRRVLAPGFVGCLHLAHPQKLGESIWLPDSQMQSHSFCFRIRMCFLTMCCLK